MFWPSSLFHGVFCLLRCNIAPGQLWKSLDHQTPTLRSLLRCWGLRSGHCGAGVSVHCLKRCGNSNDHSIRRQYVDHTKNTTICIDPSHKIRCSKHGGPNHRPRYLLFHIEPKGLRHLILSPDRHSKALLSGRKRFKPTGPACKGLDARRSSHFTEAMQRILVS